MTDLTIGGDLFRVLVTGEHTRPALMLSNSLGTDLSMWDGQMPALTEHFRVIRYDARGHGGSVINDAPTSIAQFGADALAILDALDIDKAHWLGISMGGAIGQWLLVNAPERIGRTILANSAAKFGTAENWNVRIASVLSGSMEGNVRATIERWFSPEFIERNPERVAAIRNMLRSASPQAYASCCAALRDMDLRAALASIDHDVLVISGQADTVISPEEQAAFIASMRGAEHVALAARHMSNIEAEAAFNAAVIAFLTAPPSRRKEGGRRPPTKSATAGRGGASRRSNAARSPLKKSPPKRAGTKKKGSAASPAKAAGPATPRRAQPKASVTRRGPSKTIAKRKPTKKAKPSKAPGSRRPTPIAAARAPIKKGKARGTASKAAAKKTVKKPVTAARRRPSKAPRRPTGRRKT